MFLALLVIAGSLAFLGWLVFTLAIYALPCFVGVSVGAFAHHLGAGAASAVLFGFVAGVLAFVFGRALITGARSPIVRLATLALYAGPAGVVGFGIARDVAALSGANAAWGTATGMAGAVVTMAAALSRLLAGPEGAGLDNRGRPGPLVAQQR